MKKLLDNLLSIVLLLVLAVSPVQNALASVNHANTMISVMQQEMDVSDKSSSVQNSLGAVDKMKKKHCAGHTASQCKCDISHCTNVSFIMLPTSDLSNIGFTHSNFKISSDSDLIKPLVTTLFRPPRV